MSHSSFFPQFVGCLLQAHGTRQAEVCKLGYTVSIHTTGDLRDISNLKPNGQQNIRKNQRAMRRKTPQAPGQDIFWFEVAKDNLLQEMLRLGKEVTRSSFSEKLETLKKEEHRVMHLLSCKSFPLLYMQVLQC